MVNETYSMSFTTAALLYRESIVIAELLAEMGDWDAVRDKVITENLLQMRTLNASKRIYRETASRLKQLTPAEMETFLDGSRQEQNYLLWLAICKRYRFIYDFAAAVIHEKYLRLDPILTYEDYDIFFNSKAEWHPEVEGVAPSTRRKQRQVVFKILREAEFLSADNHIIPAMLSPRLITVIAQDNPEQFTIFPVHDVDIKRWMQP